MRDTGRISLNADSESKSLATRGYARLALTNVLQESKSPLEFSNGYLSLKSASSNQDGYLTSEDWNKFNSKQDALGFIPVSPEGASFTGPVTTSNLSIGGSLYQTLKVYTNNTILDESQSFVLMNSPQDLSVNLPNGIENRIYRIKNVGSGTVLILASNNELIEQLGGGYSSSLILNSPNVVSLAFYQSTWYLF